MRQAKTILTLALTAGAAAASPPHADAALPSLPRLPSLPNAPWPQLLPATPTPNNVQPGPQPGCRRATMRCIDYEIARMSDLERRLGCDHRAVFATTYRVLTEELRDTLRRHPHFFSDTQWLIYEDALFAEYYFRSIADAGAGRAVPAAWAIAFDAARSNGANAGQDMLLGINAHVQRDMPFVVAGVGLRTRDGRTRKPDHDRVNTILEHAYERVVGTIARRYDPLISLTNASWDPVDNFGGLELVKGWREGVWRNAERLTRARTRAARARVAKSIEVNAASWARTIAAPQVPGYRAQRDEYCSTHTG
jgi:hypothetical protein